MSKVLKIFQHTPRHYRILYQTKRGYSKSQTILDRLNAGEVLICDGGLTYGLERRGYVTPGSWVPEVCLEYPEALRSIHTDYALCGSDVLEAFTFNGTDDNLNRHKKADEKRIDYKALNKSACTIVKEVADKYGCFVAAPIAHVDSYDLILPKDEKKIKVQEEFQKQVDIFKDEKVDLVIAEYIGYIEEAEWAIEVMKKSGVPVAMSMCIGPLGDFNDVPVEECGLRMARAGADIIGVNCRFEPKTSVETVKRMKQACDKEGLHAHYLCQPVAYNTADTGREGHIASPECPLALESRLMSRWDMYKFARDAYDAGIRFIGGCCGFEPYHIRAVAEELREERGGKLPINSRGLYADSLKGYQEGTEVYKRASKDYWEKLEPYHGRTPRDENQNITK